MMLFNINNFNNSIFSHKKNKNISLLLKLFIISIFLLFMQESAYSANVDITAYVYDDFTIFNYILKFENTDNISYFSIKKPIDAEISYIVDETGSIDYEEQNNYYIFKPENIKGKTFLLKFKSKSVSNQVYLTDSFKTYQSFDFPVNELKFRLLLKEDFGEVISAFPINYDIITTDSIMWTNYNITREMLYVANFKESIKPVEEKNINYFYYIGLSFIILTAVVVMILSYIKFSRMHEKNKKLENNVKDNKNNAIKEEENKDKNEDSSEDKTHKQEININITEDHVEEDMPEIVIEDKDLQKEEEKKIQKEFISRHLTENEQKVVAIVKENEGIQQNDILNHIPIMTKSNLSKIIAKLHVRRVLKRIRVGKVNNIYLGSKLEKPSLDDEDKKENMEKDEE